MPHLQTADHSPVHVIDGQRDLAWRCQLIGYPGFRIERIRIVGEQCRLLGIINEANRFSRFAIPCRKAIEPSSSRRASVIHAFMVAASARPDATAGAAAPPIPCATSVRSKILTTPSPLTSTGESAGTLLPICRATRIKSRILTTPSRFTSPDSNRSFTVKVISSGPAGMSSPVKEPNRKFRSAKLVPPLRTLP